MGILNVDLECALPVYHRSYTGDLLRQMFCFILARFILSCFPLARSPFPPLNAFRFLVAPFLFTGVLADEDTDVKERVRLVLA